VALAALTVLLRAGALRAAALPEPLAPRQQSFALVKCYWWLEAAKVALAAEELLALVLPVAAVQVVVRPHYLTVDLEQEPVTAVPDKPQALVTAAVPVRPCGVVAGARQEARCP
jgi:hypothetical protein